MKARVWERATRRDLGEIEIRGHALVLEGITDDQARADIERIFAKTPELTAPELVFAYLKFSGGDAWMEARTPRLSYTWLAGVTHMFLYPAGYLAVITEPD
jgi:hypothetical protein